MPAENSDCNYKGFISFSFIEVTPTQHYRTEKYSGGQVLEGWVTISMVALNLYSAIA
uniref:Uncharacterized protein n=1 Tax=Arundo donax TaxID=35708 RepID=A0A0A9H257_ARUDO